MRQINDNIIPVQAAATVTTSAIPALNLIYMSAQITATGSGAGTLKFQASNDYVVASNAVPVNWSDIPSASIVVAGAGSYLIPKTEICYEYVRLIYTNTGTGTISVVFKALGE